MTLALVTLLIFWPVMGIVALMVWTRMGRPVIFRQERPGLHGDVFVLRKFRSMTNERDAKGRLLPPDQRMTRLGRFLRKTSFDELPEIINVLRGEMSLVGPRPLLVDYLSLYSAEQARRHDVRPGLTGWAQVNGRNALTWEGRFGLDVWYVDNISPWLDIRIMALTVLSVLKREGINAQGDRIMPRFTGTNAQEV